MDRNNPCHCDSGKKYKNCHLYLDEGWIKEEYGWRLPSFKEIMEMIAPKKQRKTAKTT